MQHVSSFTTVPAADRKALALNAYDVALSDPGAADWQAVAHLLRAAIPAGREPAARDNTPRWWADYPLPKNYAADSVVVTFEDGRQVRCNIFAAPNKLPRIAAACRAAIGFYRARTRYQAVPAFERIERVSDGHLFDAEACSQLTADLRSAEHFAEPARPAVTLERIERMTAEVERRRAGLATATKAYAAFKAGKVDSYRGATPDEWRAALRAGEAALADMRRSCVALIPAVTIEAANVNVEAGVEPVDSAPEIQSAQAVEVVASELTGEIAQDRKLTKNACLPFHTHTIVAVCTSHRGREKLLGLIQDGTFRDPERGYGSLHGAYRITLQDAQEIGEIRGVRYVGMPRKPRSKSVEAVPAPVTALAAPSPCRALMARLSASVAMHTRAVA